MRINTSTKREKQAFKETHPREKRKPRGLRGAAPSAFCPGEANAEARGGPTSPWPRIPPPAGEAPLKAMAGTGRIVNEACFSQDVNSLNVK